MGLVDVDEILARDLNDAAPSGIRPFLRPGERVLIAIRGVPGAIVATSQRVIVERSVTPLAPTIFEYSELTGATAKLGLFSRRYVALTGPGLNPAPGLIEIGRSKHATVVRIDRLASTRQAVAELNLVIPAMQARPPDPVPNGSIGIQAPALVEPGPGLLLSPKARGSWLRRPRAYVLVGVAVVAVAAIVVAAQSPADRPGRITASTPLASNAGSVVFTDSFNDPASGWSTTSLASGSTYTYTADGFVVHAVGAEQHLRQAPYSERHEQVSVAMTATQAAGAPGSAGFGVVCLRGSSTAGVGYGFTDRADGRWLIVRIDRAAGHLTALAAGAAPVVPGAQPVTVEGMCVTLASSRTTRLLLFVDGTSVADLTDTAATNLPDVGWQAGLDIESGTSPSTVTVTAFSERNLSP